MRLVVRNLCHGLFCPHRTSPGWVWYGLHPYVCPSVFLYVTKKLNPPFTAWTYFNKFSLHLAKWHWDGIDAGIVFPSKTWSLKKKKCILYFNFFSLLQETNLFLFWPYTGKKSDQICQFNKNNSAEIYEQAGTIKDQ